MPSNGSVWIFKNSPSTSEGETTYTSSVQFGIAGNVGYSSVPATSANVQLNISHSQQRTIKDVNIYNKATSEGHHARWRFDLNNLAVRHDQGNAFSHSCFQPYVQWIWRVDREQADATGVYFVPQEKQERYFSFTLNLNGTFSPIKNKHNL